MTEHGNNTAGPDRSGMVRLATKATANLDACGESVEKAVVDIARSCDTLGTRGAAHQEMLREKIGALENLAALCSKGAKRLSDVTAKLRSDSAEEEALAELLAVSRFIGDQLRSEKEDVRRILSTLQDHDGCGEGC